MPQPLILKIDAMEAGCAKRVHPGQLCWTIADVHGVAIGHECDTRLVCGRLSIKDDIDKITGRRAQCRHVRAHGAGNIKDQRDLGEDGIVDSLGRDRPIDMLNADNLQQGRVGAPGHVNANTGALGIDVVSEGKADKVGRQVGIQIVANCLFDLRIAAAQGTHARKGGTVCGGQCMGAILRGAGVIQRGAGNSDDWNHDQAEDDGHRTGGVGAEGFQFAFAAQPGGLRESGRCL